MNISPSQPIKNSMNPATPLTSEQIDDLYFYVIQHGKLTDNDTRFVLATSIAKEETVFCDSGPDYYSVYISTEGWPVAAAAPLDSSFYLIQ